MKRILLFLLFSCTVFMAKSQTVAQMKKVLDTTQYPVAYVKFVLKKKYFIDTVAVMSTNNFLGKADSLAYSGKIGKTYAMEKG